MKPVSTKAIRDTDAVALRAFLRPFAEIPEDEWNAFKKKVRRWELAKGDLFIQEGEVPRYLGLVVSGFFKKFYRNSDGDEFVKEFCGEGALVTGYTAFILNQPTKLNIQALEHSVVLIIKREDHVALYPRHACWQEAGRRVAERLYMDREHREYQLLMLSASERYDAFLEEFPEMRNRIPQYLIASYLGITPVALSRIIAARVKARRNPSKKGTTLIS